MQSVYGSLDVWLFDIRVTVMGILPTLYFILSVMLSTESKFTHIRDVLHQRLLAPQTCIDNLDPPLNDKTEVPLFHPPLPPPTHTTIKSYTLLFS